MWSALYIHFLKLNNVWILYFLVSFATNPNSTCKSHFFSKTSTCSIKEAVILFLSWSALFRKFSRSRILLLEVVLSLLTQISCEKLIYFGNSWCFVKEIVILILYTAFQKCSALNSVFSSGLPLLTHIAYVKVFFPGILGASLKKKQYCSFCRAVCI